MRAALARLAGVHSVQADAGQLVVRAAVTTTDEVLRLALADPGVHVVAVQGEDGAAACVP